jgi:hypothetical protein
VCPYRLILGDVDAVLEPEEPPLDDIGSVERNDAKGDVGLSLGEIEQTRARQDLDADIGGRRWKNPPGWEAACGPPACFRTKAICASENFEAFIEFSSSSQQGS